MLVNTPSKKQATITTIVESLSSPRVGQLAFCNSPTSSLKKIRALRKGLAIVWDWEEEVAGAEGIEPPTNGFGDRYSTN